MAKIVGFGSKHRAAIIDNHEELAKKTMELERLLEILKNKNKSVFTDDEVDSMLAVGKVDGTLSEENRIFRNQLFYMNLVRKDDSVYFLFLEALTESEQTTVACVIDAKYNNVSNTLLGLGGIKMKIPSFGFGKKKEKSSKSEKGSKIEQLNKAKVEDQDNLKEGENNEKVEEGMDEKSTGGQAAINIKNKASADSDLRMNCLEISKEKEPTPAADEAKIGSGLEIKDEDQPKDKKKKSSVVKMMTNFIPKLVASFATAVETEGLWENKLNEALRSADLKTLQKEFRKYDTSKDGKISSGEFFQLMHTEYGFTLDEAQLFLNQHDVDNDGEIDYFEFVSMFLPRMKNV